MSTITDLIKQAISQQIDETTIIDSDKKEQATEAVAAGAYEGLSNAVSSQKLDGIISLLKGTQDSQAKEVEQDIESGIVSKLSKQVGLNANSGKMVSGLVMPFIIKMISKKIGTKSDGGFDISSLIGMFSKGNSAQNLLGGLGGSIGKLLK